MGDSYRGYYSQADTRSLDFSSFGREGLGASKGYGFRVQGGRLGLSGLRFGIPV